MASKYAVVQARHKKQCGHTRLGHAHKTNERAQEAVEEKVEMIENEIKLVVPEQESPIGIVSEKESTQIPNYYSFKQEDGHNWQQHLGKVLGDKVELDEKLDDYCDHHNHLKRNQVSPKQVADRISTWK